MGKLSFQEFESKIKFYKNALAEAEEYKDANNIIKKDIAYVPIDFKNNLGKKILTYE